MADFEGEDSGDDDLSLNASQLVRSYILKYLFINATKFYAG